MVPLGSICSLEVSLEYRRRGKKEHVDRAIKISIGHKIHVLNGIYNSMGELGHSYVKAIQYHSIEFIPQVCYKRSP